MGILFFQISSKSTNDRNKSEGGIATFGMKTMGRRKGNAICIMATGLGGRDWQYNVFLSMTLQMDLVAGGPKESFMEAKALIKHDNNNNVMDCVALRLEPKDGLVVVDGELVEMEPIQMQIHKGFLRAFCL